MMREAGRARKLAFVVAASFACAGAFLATACGQAVAETPPIVATNASVESDDYSRPNIVILLADDLGWQDVGFNGGDIPTPAIDGLARDGMVLGQLYTAPICTPTRTALMTGKDPVRLGALYAGFQPWSGAGIDPREIFMPEAFREAGYRTGMVGKWHLGYQAEAHVPNSRGFDYFAGHLNTSVGFYDYKVAGGVDVQRNGKTISPERYATDFHADEAVRFIKQRNPEQPFFLYVPFLAPHYPLEAPPELIAKYADSTDLRGRQIFMAMVDSLDQAVGRILATLDDEGIAENTIVLFFSDNGGMATLGGDNGPLRGGKGDTFEGGIRVPAVIRWPGQIPAGERSAQYLWAADIYPSLVEAAGIEIRSRGEIDGESVWPQLSANRPKPRNGYFFFASESPISGFYHLAVRHRQWKLVQTVDHSNRAVELTNYLFDIEQDPYEQNNLAARQPELVNDLSDRINAWRSRYHIAGVRVQIVPHPGWRAPLDYADAVARDATLQDSPDAGMVPESHRERLQRMYGERGRLTGD